MSLPKEHGHHAATNGSVPSARDRVREVFSLDIASSSADVGEDVDMMQPLYPYALGLLIALVFSFVLGFGATFAEPALRGTHTHDAHQ
jgi:hypothetical protein